MQKLSLKIRGQITPEVLTREQLKKVMGGQAPMTTIKCSAKSCSKWVGGADGSMQVGTCKSETVAGLPYCACSISGASGC